MGLFRKVKAKQDVLPTTDAAPRPASRGLSKALSLRNEAEFNREIEEKVRKQMLDLFSPAWTSQTDRMLQFIYRGCAEHDFFESWDHSSTIISARSGLHQEVFPKGLTDAQKFIDTATLLNSEACFLMTTNLVAEFVRNIPPGQFEVTLSANLRIQVRHDLGDFKYSKHNQRAAFLKATGQLLFWADDFQSILPFAVEVEEAIANHLWAESKKQEQLQEDREKEDTGDMDPETHLNSNRPVQLLLPVMVFTTILINFLVICLAVRISVYESLRSGNWYRLLIFLYFPLVFFLTSFFSLMLVVTVINFIGPVAQLFQNSKFYSCQITKRITKDFPHITIQCPVYKEDLEDVIVPTVQSLRVAISTYERQGGTASIFINDDGLQLVSPEQREMRKAYYKLNEIGWVARPGHGKNGFGEFCDPSIMI